MAQRAAALSLALAAAAAPASYSNPLSRADAPDPGVAFDAASGLYFSGTTTGGAPCFALRSSPDLATWTDLGFAFAADALPAWVSPTNPSCWAPELHNVSGGWRMLYVARTRAGVLSVGIATSAAPAGPWADVGAPVVTAAQGQIDPTLARDEAGALVLIWKTDGNADGRPCPIRYAPLNDAATALAPGADWSATQLITNDLAWEGPVVEAPWVVKRNDTWYLFYSGNGYGDTSYAVGVARSRALRGPYIKHGAPILATQPGAKSLTGPGHCSVLPARDGVTAIVYHAHVDPTAPQRQLMLDALAWRDDGAGGEWPEMASGRAWPGAGVQPIP